MDELRAGLELATTEELKGLTSLLFTRRFNPLDYLMGIECSDVLSQSRQSCLDRLERRFRFLAADGLTILTQRSNQISYHEILRRVCKHLNIQYSNACSTLELEELVFLHVLDLAYQKLPSTEQASLERYFQRSLTSLRPNATFLPSDNRGSLRLLLKGSTALMIGSMVKPFILRKMIGQVALRIARYRAIQQTLAGCGSIVGAMHHRTLLGVAKRGATLAFVRYSAMRGALSIIGPTLWLWFFADLGWRSIATNYRRIVPVIVMIAQIRLLRGGDL